MNVNMGHPVLSNTCRFKTKFDILAPLENKDMQGIASDSWCWDAGVSGVHLIARAESSVGAFLEAHVL